MLTLFNTSYIKIDRRSSTANNEIKRPDKPKYHMGSQITMHGCVTGENFNLMNNSDLVMPYGITQLGHHWFRHVRSTASIDNVHCEVTNPIIMGHPVPT